MRGSQIGGTVLDAPSLQVQLHQEARTDWEDAVDDPSFLTSFSLISKALLKLVFRGSGMKGGKNNLGRSCVTAI